MIEATSIMPKKHEENHMPKSSKSTVPKETPEEGEGKAVETPLMDELSKGPWPSHARELQRTSYPVMMYEEAMREKYTQWGHGGMSSVPGLGSGAIARKSRRPDIISHSHLIRVLGTPGCYYKTATFRKICELAEKYGDGSLHMLTTNSNLEICGLMNGDDMKAITEGLNSLGYDVGSAGDAIRNIPDCMGPSLCEHAVMDTPRIKHFMTRLYIDDIQYPRFPFKIKTKMSGCPNECGKALLHADIGIIGVFKDLPKVDNGRLREWITHGGDIIGVCDRCPTDAMKWNNTELEIDPDSCIRCMYCINRVPAIKPGDDRGVAITAGGKMKGKLGPMKGKVVFPFVKVTPPDYKELVEAYNKLCEVYDEHGKKKERIGDMIQRLGFDRFIELCGVEPSTMHFSSPRRNTFYHWHEEELGGVK
jgi:sulfite reductase alpha subunit